MLDAVVVILLLTVSGLLGVVAQLLVWRNYWRNMAQHHEAIAERAARKLAAERAGNALQGGAHG